MLPWIDYFHVYENLLPFQFDTSPLHVRTLCTGRCLTVQTVAALRRTAPVTQQQLSLSSRPVFLQRASGFIGIHRPCQWLTSVRYILLLITDGTDPSVNLTGHPSPHQSATPLWLWFSGVWRRSCRIWGNTRRISSSCTCCLWSISCHIWGKCHKATNIKVGLASFFFWGRKFCTDCVHHSKSLIVHLVNLSGAFGRNFCTFFLFQLIWKRKSSGCRVPLTSFLSPLAVTAVFWPLSRCHEETNNSPSLSEHITARGMLIIVAWFDRGKRNVLSGSWILSQAAVLSFSQAVGLPFPGWWRSLSTRRVVPRHSLPLGLISWCKLISICSGERSIRIFGWQLFIQTFEAFCLFGFMKIWFLPTREQRVWGGGEWLAFSQSLWLQRPHV